ncbi:MAG: LapA family protein [Deltaproteobacteria bacterium]|nr:LapA family protein [Candidatus Anaeroferrophillus wilburensis]MBN2888288.1 LapA family protein [Deltaproteobacteria bacterium]
MRYVKIAFLLVFLTLLLVFIFQNVTALSAAVNLHYDLLVTSLGPLDIPLYALLFLSLFTGAFSVAAVDMLLLFRQRRALKKKEQQIRELESELAKFRNLPLTETAELAPEGASSHLEAQPGS